jgi:hypothetical protein
MRYRKYDRDSSRDYGRIDITDGYEGSHWRKGCYDCEYSDVKYECEEYYKRIYKLLRSRLQ